MGGAQIEKKGTLIVIDGCDGAGKTGVLECLRENPAFKDTVFSREPGGTNIGEATRLILKDAEKFPNMHVTTEVLLMCASRAQHVHELIVPALEAGKDVILDRFNMSTFAYQLFGGGRFDLFDQVIEIDAFARGFISQTNESLGLTVDLTIILDVPAEVGRQRRSSRTDPQDRFEKQGEVFQQDVQKGFMYMCENFKNNAIVIDTTQGDESDIQQKVAQIIQDFLAKD